jgi:signal transduction histidine kinase/CheY-like chemotaxis protein
MTYLLGTYLIRRPLDRLLDVADRWRTGDLAARTGIPDDGSEFGRLAGAFDSMAAAQEARVGGEVAAREAAQARAAHAERMQALGQLAGGIAHDFNNVLQAVAGAATLIERHPADEIRVRRLARLAIEAVERGASITRRLLAFGRRSDLRAEPLDVAPVLNGLREILVHTLGAAIIVDVKPDPSVPPLLADKGQLETALVNLATNARDAMPEGGQLTLSASAETVESDGPPHPAGLPAGRYVRLTVADTGAGMDAATRERAVEPFFTTKHVGAGTGLGLPMAKGFAEQSGGALSVESNPGAGTTPVAGSVASPAPMTEPPVAAVAAEPGMIVTGASARRALILLVDDEAPVRELLAEHLEDAGYRVLATASGAAALALLATAETVDILITDLSMPGMDGLAVIRAAQERLPRLPAVLLTGYAGDGAALAVAGTVSGIFSLLRKPVSGVELIDRVRTLLAGAGKSLSNGARMHAASGSESG